MAYSIYIFMFILAAAISYLSATYMIDATNKYTTSVFVATIINLQLGAFFIFGWFFYSWDINESLFFNGLYWGLTMLVISNVGLIGWFYYRWRKSTGKEEPSPSTEQAENEGA